MASTITSDVDFRKFDDDNGEPVSPLPSYRRDNLKPALLVISSPSRAASEKYTGISRIWLQPCQSIERSSDLVLPMLVASYLNDPLWMSFLPQERQRKRLLEFFFPLRLHIFDRNSLAVMHRDNASSSPARIIGHVAICPPGHTSMRYSMWQTIKLGFWRLSCILGCRVYRDFNALVKVYSQMQAEVFGRDVDLKDGYWALEAMAIDPEFRGQGIGTQVMKEALKGAVDSDNRPVILLTQKASTLNFYNRLGFYVIDDREVEIPGSGSRVRNWIMKRPSGLHASIIPDS